MKILGLILKKRSVAISFLLLILIVGNAPRVFAHGGEDHGDSAPQATTDSKGTVSRSARLGEYELTLRHPLFEPDTATEGRIFITEFATNAAVTNAATAIEIESAKGSLTQAVVEKTETAGIYQVKMPPLAAGTYTIRAKLTYRGETDTATFAGVEVKTASVAMAENEMSVWRTMLISLIFALVLLLFGGLTYLVLRDANGKPNTEETVAT